MVHFDFEFLLLLLTLVSGLVWLADILFLRRARERGKGAEAPREPIIVEYSKAFFPVLAVVLVLRAFVVEPFRIPSGSMMPTLLVGDFILVNKFSYGLRLPVWQTRVSEGERPRRGDVVVFRYPRDESQDYIKRVVGLPGDRISYYNRRLSVNGKLLEIEENGLYRGLGDGNFLEVVYGAQSVELVAGRLSLDSGTTMGDNRDHSNDSRMWGFVPEDNLVGKAFLIWMHWDWRSGGTGLDISRIGSRISQ